MDELSIFIVLLIVVILFVVVLAESYNRDDERMIRRIKNDLETVYPGINSICVITSGQNTYTDNKRIVYILLRDDDGRFYDYNTLIYASLHEIAHVVTPDLDHTPLYVANFRALLTKAKNKGIFIPGKVNNGYCHQCVV
jgi:hypothetical protein